MINNNISTVKIDAKGVYYRDLNVKLRDVLSNGAGKRI